MISSADRTEIVYSRTKTLFLLILGLAMTGLALFLALEGHRIYVQIAGFVGTLFFGAATFAGLWVLFQKKPGLVLDETGICMHLLWGKPQTYLWTDVIGIGEYSVSGQSMVTLLLRNPDSYLGRMTRLARMGAKANIKLCGSPVGFSANNLQISARELYDLIDQYHQKYRRKDGPENLQI